MTEPIWFDAICIAPLTINHVGHQTIKVSFKDEKLPFTDRIHAI